MPEIQQPDILGNYLSAYNQQQDRNYQQQARQQAMDLNMRADQRAEKQFQMSMDSGQLKNAMDRVQAEIDFFGNLPANINDAQWEQAKQTYSSRFGVPLEQIAGRRKEDLPALRDQSGATLRALQIEATKANIAQSRAATAASYASAARNSSPVLQGATDRAKLAQALGIDVSSPTGKRYLLTGQLPAPMTATDREAVMTADQTVLSTQQAVDMLRQAKKLSDKSYEGFGANTRASIAANLGFDYAQPTLEFDNLILNQILPQLKPIFGGAPTEGERQILVDLQASSSMPRELRNRLLDNALKMAQQRLEFNQRKANELRSGSYYNPASATPNAPQPAARTTPPPAAPAQRAQTKRGVPIPPGFDIISED